MRPETPDQIPGQIGPYRILREIGRGGMGVVYLGLDPRLERPVAIKLLSERLSRNEEWRARFEQEARLLASLNHPNIATIHSLEWDASGERGFLTMELIEGVSLAERLSDGALSIPDALSVGRQIARAVEAAHAKGVVHRDLKPLNVMITTESLVKVLDFGLASRAIPGSSSGSPLGDEPPKAETEPGSDVAPGPGAPGPGPNPVGSGDSPGKGSLETEFETAAIPPPTVRSGGTGPRAGSRLSSGTGTPGYMSPEQILGHDLDARVDVWAFGCVLYECLSGRRLFAGPTPSSRKQATLHGPLDLEDLPEATPASVRELLVSCLERDGNARPNDLSMARETLEVALARRDWEPSVQLGRAQAEAAGADAMAELHNLRSGVSSFVGRERELRRILELLAENRLVTLSGVGGGGKTRLSMRVGEEALREFPHGVWMVELASVADHGLVLSAVAKVFGVTEKPGESLETTLTSHLAARSLLLILDNCEHVIDACASLVVAVLREAPGIRIVATSRETLRVPAEAVFEVPPLTVASSQTTEEMLEAEAVQLFSQRAAQVRIGFVLDDENVHEVAEICRRLDGLPLAIELAAARTKVLSLSEIAERLDDRFRLLKGSTRGVLPHHQTLDALIDWSYSHLTENEQTLFRRLAVFRGGWALGEAESVCGGDPIEEWEVLDFLTRLIEKSLVVFDPIRSRYAMLETVREFAASRLENSEDRDAVSGRFQQVFAKLAEDAAKELMGLEQPRWLARLDEERDNLRAMLDRAIEAGDVDVALPAATQMLRYWIVRGSSREGRDTMVRALLMPGVEARKDVLGPALNSLGSCHFQLHEFDSAAENYRRAAEVLIEVGDRSRAGGPLQNLGNVYRLQGNLEKAAESFTESLTYIDPSDRWTTAAVRLNLGSVALLQEDYALAEEASEIGRAIFGELGDRAHGTVAVMNLGLVALRQGRLADARAFLEEASATFAEMGDRNLGPTAEINLGIVLMAMGEAREAGAALSGALRVVSETGNLDGMGSCIEGLAGLSLRNGDEERGIRLMGAAEGLRAGAGTPLTSVDQRAWDADTAKLRAELGEAEYDRLHAEGAALSRGDMITLALGAVRGTD